MDGQLSRYVRWHLHFPTRREMKEKQHTAQKMTVDTEKHLGKANDVLKALRVSYTEKFEQMIMGFMYLRR